MKMISRGTWGAVLGLGLLSFNVPGDGADDWAIQQAQAQREREECQRQQEQAQRDREQADRDRQAQDDWYRQQAQAQRERDEWYQQQAQAQRDREQADRDRQAQDEWYRQQAQERKDNEDWYKAQKEREDWQKYQDYYQSLWGSGYDAQPAGTGSVRSARRTRHAVWPQPLMIVNPFVVQPKEGRNPERAGRAIKPPGQPIMQVLYPQIIRNPFVSSPEQIMQGGGESDPLIRNPFVVASK